MGYPLDTESEFTLEHNRLIMWRGANRAQWTFSIYLLSLNSVQALVDRVVNPAIALTSLETNDPILAILPDDLPGLVSYENRDVLIADEGDAEPEGI